MDMWLYSFSLTPISTLHPFADFPYGPRYVLVSPLTSCPVLSRLDNLERIPTKDPENWNQISAHIWLPDTTTSPHVILYSFCFSRPVPSFTLWLYMSDSWIPAISNSLCLTSTKPELWKFSLPLVSRTVQSCFVFHPSFLNTSLPVLSDSVYC